MLTLVLFKHSNLFMLRGSLSACIFRLRSPKCALFKILEHQFREEDLEMIKNSAIWFFPSNPNIILCCLLLLFLLLPFVPSSLLPFLSTFCILLYISLFCLILQSFCLLLYWGEGKRRGRERKRKIDRGGEGTSLNVSYSLSLFFTCHQSSPFFLPSPNTALRFIPLLFSSLPFLSHWFLPLFLLLPLASPFSWSLPLFLPLVFLLELSCLFLLLFIDLVYSAPRGLKKGSEKSWVNINADVEKRST